MTVQDIKTNVTVRRQIFDNIPNHVRPGWAGLILSRFDRYIENIPTPINELYSIIDQQDRWKEAHNQFNEIRRFLLDNKNYQPESYLLLAENVAKVTYNASNEPAPFDHDSGWWIPSCALEVATFFDDNRLEAEVINTILVFSRNKKNDYNLTTFKDFLIYKRIDDILWFDWDPIGVKEFAPKDEYQRYIPEIFNLKKSGANRNEIASRLLRLENEKIGIDGTLDNCLIIADKIIQA